MTKTRNLLVLIGVFILFQSCGCGSLEPGGVYQSNKILYDADLTIATSFNAIHGFVLWEKDNEVALNSPEVKAFADKVRLEAPKAFKTAIAMRDAYKISSTEVNKDNLNKALNVLLELISSINKYYTISTQ